MRTVVIVGTALIATAAGARAQVAARAGCSAEEAVGSIGVSLIECDCVIAPAALRTPWQFWTEPRVLRIEQGSPAASQLQVGDVITHVNGQRVTSEAGARALARLKPEQTVTLTIRRGERTLRQAIRSGSTCPSDPVLLGATPAIQRVLVGAQTGAVAEASRRTVPLTVTPVAVAHGSALPFAWIGIAFSCTDCVYQNVARAARAGALTGRWTFATPPMVYSVEGGSPAHAAGIRRGDVLTHVDDHLITSEEGRRRWAQIRPGEKVRLRYRRGSTIRYTTVQASAPPGIAATTIRPGQAPLQLKVLEATLANAESVSAQHIWAAERRRQEGGQQEQVLERVLAAQQQALRQLEQLQQGVESAETRRRAAELLETLARAQDQLRQLQQRQVQELMRANQQLQAGHDSIGRAVTALSGVYAAAVAAEERLRYSGTFGSTDIEVRSVIPVVVTETATDVTIRAGDTVVTLKRTRQ